MPPKKAKKISLNEFLGDDTLGSWADEMDALPSAPAPRNDDDQGRDRFGRRGDDFLASRPDRGPVPPREDIPLPTSPPYTAFIGNLAFDLTESELEDYFAPAKAKSVKIIRDKDDKPKGFGYIEFEDLDGLKDAMTKSGSQFSGRTIRVSVAEPPKERSFGSGAHEDDSKFDNPWRRDGPLPDRDSSSRRRFEGAPAERLPSVAEGVNDWRSNRPARADPDPTARRRGSGFSTHNDPPGPSAADQADVWTKGAKFVPSSSSGSPGGEDQQRFGSMRGRGDMGPPRERESPSVAEEGDWRRPKTQSNVSPSNSTPPTPQMGRRKLELLPRSGNTSVSPSPLSSPRMPPATSTGSTSRASPFGAARPVDVSNKDKEVTERLDKEREVNKDRLSMSRTSSRTGFERSPLTRTPPPSAGSGSSSPKPAAAVAALGGHVAAAEGHQNGQSQYQQLQAPKPSLVPSVRPTLSFANAAARKAGEEKKLAGAGGGAGDDEVDKIAEKVADIAV